MATQPVWRIVANLGDVGALDHGGAFVMVDITGEYGPELEVYQPAADGRTGEVYRAMLEPHTWLPAPAADEYANACDSEDAAGVLSDNKFHPDNPVWYADRMAGVAQSIGQPQRLIRAWLVSDSATSRARGIMAVAGYFGWDNFDHMPSTITRGEAARRYRTYLRRPSRSSLGSPV